VTRVSRHPDYPAAVRSPLAHRTGGRRLLALLAFAGIFALALGVGRAGGTAVGSQAPAFTFAGSGDLEVISTAVRDRPAASGKVIARLPQFRPDYRPMTVLALAVRTAQGRPAWYRISVPGRPNGRTGWIPASAVKLHPVTRQIVIYRGARRMELWRGNTLEYSTTVAVGAPGMETPLGLFYVTVRFRPVQQPFLGVFAFETSAYSKLTDWPGGGRVGIHGTYQPQLLGQAVSHGCVRMSNTAAAFLRDRVGVGTPIRILP
jgi:lipoprotein-anchoring transpeptidase ErfK/SrfK